MVTEKEGETTLDDKEKSTLLILWFEFDRSLYLSRIDKANVPQCLSSAAEIHGV